MQLVVLVSKQQNQLPLYVSKIINPTADFPSANAPPLKIHNNKTFNKTADCFASNMNVKASEKGNKSQKKTSIIAILIKKNK